MKIAWTFTGVVSLVMLIVLAGCLSISERLTPAERDRQAEEYVTESGVADPCDFQSWLYPNLHDLYKLEHYVDHAHTTNQLEFQHAIESDETQYGFLRDRVAANLQTAAADHEAWFGDTGYVSVLMGMAGLGAGWTLLKRPGDVKVQTAPGAFGLNTSKAIDVVGTPNDLQARSDT
ncbi:MAG: hypothetical protein JW936_10540 [Sedimentisphaerales bacterium]|nr:hypothetical protein [Sedimentisphaerales bacterium]